MCGRLCEFTLFLASYDVEVIRPELFCMKRIMDLSILSCIFYVF
jgi:hypothetical protein